MPISEGTGAVIAAGISTAGSLANSAVKNRRGYKWSKKLNEATMDYQQAINLRNWRMQNNYNSPSAQMARLRAAGLNPNMIYQNGGAVSGAGEIASPSASGQFDYSVPDFNSALQVYNSTGLASKQQDQLQAAIDNLTENTKALKGENQLKYDSKPLRELSNASLFTDEQRTYYANLFGMSAQEVSSLSGRSVEYLLQLKNLEHQPGISKQTLANLRATESLLYNQSNTEFNRASSAYFVQLMDMLNARTEFAKRGINPQDKFYGTGFSGSNSDLPYSDDLDMVLQFFLHNVKEADWQSSNTKHFFDTFNQTVSSVGNVIPKYHKGMFSEPYHENNFNYHIDNYHKYSK